MNLLTPLNSNPCPPVSECRHHFVRSGHFSRSDGSRHQRYRCKLCGKTVSDPTFSPCYRQRRRDLNPLIFGHLVSCVSMRRSAILLKTNRKTIVRKFLILGQYCKELLNESLNSFAAATEVEFDDLETFVHSKLKPVSVLAMIETGSRRILGWRVAEMPAKGRLAQRSREKYGHRTDERKPRRKELFEELGRHIEPNATLKSDKNPHYPPDIKTHFPHAKHVATKGRRGCVVGQGELKSGGRDPLFTLNHTYAMFRDNIKRLSRKTWCTTKLKERLDLHIAMYAIYHNYRLIPQIGDPRVRWPRYGSSSAPPIGINN